MMEELTAPPSSMMPLPNLAGGETDPNAVFYDPELVNGALPVNLDSLVDGPPGSKPFYPYSTLIRYAIKGSPNQKLLLEDIYYAIESRFPYYRTCQGNWKNSIRHNLSLNPCFEKTPRPLTDRGKGSYWQVNEHVDPRTGVHRIRKKKYGKRKGSEGVADEADGGPQAPTSAAEFTPQLARNEEQQDYQQHHLPPPPEFAMGPPPPMQFAQGHQSAGLEFDKDGQVDWRLSWIKELGHLQSLTQHQTEVNVDAEWYRMMFIRMRSAFIQPKPIEGIIDVTAPPSIGPPLP